MHVDGTVFAYGGARILQRDLPYRDFWDHKPPGVFYLNALALWLWGVDAWSIWYLTVVWTIMVAGSFYWFLVRLVPRRYALLGSAILLVTVLQPRFYQGANLTEFYGLLPAIFSLLITHAYLKHGRLAAIAALGGAFAIGALLKHTNIATALASIGVITYVELRLRGVRGAIRGLSVFAVLPLTTAIFIALYWGSHDALQDLWQATIEYNLLSSGDVWNLRSLYGSFRTVAADPSLGPLFILTFGAALTHWSTRRSWKDPLLRPEEGGLGKLAVDWIYVVCFAAVITEILFISLAGRGFGHYYIALMPALCASVSYWFPSTLTTSNRISSNDGKRQRPQLIVIAALLVWLIVTLGLVRPSADDIRSFVLDAPVRRPLRTNVGKYVTSQTESNDPVLVWDLGAEINFETGRRAPSRYTYYLPLFLPGYQNEERWQEFLDDLQANRPSLVIAHWQSGFAPAFDVPLEQLASRCHCDGAILAGFRAFSEHMRSNYERELLFDETFAVYHRKIQ